MYLLCMTNVLAIKNDYKFEKICVVNKWFVSTHNIFTDVFTDFLHFTSSLIDNWAIINILDDGNTVAEESTVAEMAMLPRMRGESLITVD